MRVSRQHRMLMRGPRAELLFGADEVLVRAQHLTRLPGVVAVKVAEVTCLHRMFDRHEIIPADGTCQFRKDLEQFAAARVALRSFEAKVLLAA